MLLDPEDRLLMFQVRDPVTRVYGWITPGGGVNEGETLEEGARRELFEETGLRDVELGPPIWRGRRRFVFHGRDYDQDETFFLARVSPFEMDHGAREDYELDMEHRWWTLEELASTEEWLSPVGLGGLVEDLVANGPPEQTLTLPD